MNQDTYQRTKHRRLTTSIDRLSAEEQGALHLLLLNSFIERLGEVDVVEQEAVPAFHREIALL
jgi:hypothetical protein